MGIDIDKDFYSVRPIDGDWQKVKQFFVTNGMIGSYLEGGVFEQIFGGEAVSTIHILDMANKQGINIYHITSDNAKEILPKLQYNESKKQMLQNLINSGKEITIPEKNVIINGWDGTGYIVLNPKDGTGAYMIDGGLSGGFTEALAKYFTLLICVFVLIYVMAFMMPAVIPALTAGYLALVAFLPIFAVLPEWVQNTIFSSTIGLITSALGLVIGGPVGLAIGLIGLANVIVNQISYIINRPRNVVYNKEWLLIKNLRYA